MKKLISIILLTLTLTACEKADADDDGRSNRDEGANCGGGCQVNRPDLSPVEVVQPDGSVCYVIVPAGIDLTTCESVPASDNSHLQYWICDDLTVDIICPE